MVRSPESLRVWQRAAVLGSLWASVEIVVGSFLHNLSVPLAGSVLAAFGVSVMTAGHRLSPDRGVIWRAALICALMKSVSPSAVILGPMIGILMEGLLLQASVRLLGANAVGYVAGGALAVSWSFAQKIASALIAFGPNVVRLYVEAYDYAAKLIGVSRFGPFDLVVTLLVLECVMGAAAAVVGMRLAKAGANTRRASFQARRGGAAFDAAEARKAPPDAGMETSGGPPTRQRSAAGAGAVSADFVWSIPRLVAFLSGLVGGMVLLGVLRLPLAALYVGAYSSLVFLTYPRALARLKRAWFWIQMIGVLLLAGLLLGGLRNGTAGLLVGLDAGAQMVLRATLVVLGFTAVSVELRNPTILAWLERRRFRGLSDAMGLAFGALPAFMAALADQRAFWRQPLTALSNLVQTADSFYASRAAARQQMVILTGETGSGKTTRAAEVVEVLRQRGLKVAGLLAKGLLTDSRRSGFDLVDLSTGRTVPLCREGQAGGHGGERWSRFEFTREGLDLGREALAANSLSADVVIVDEVGPLELAGGGWAEPLDALVNQFKGQILIVARLAVVEAVKARWGAATTPVLDVSTDGPRRIADVIVERLAAADPESLRRSPSRGPSPA